MVDRDRLVKFLAIQYRDLAISALPAVYIGQNLYVNNQEANGTGWDRCPLDEFLSIANTIVDSIEGHPKTISTWDLLAALLHSLLAMQERGEFVAQSDLDMLYSILPPHLVEERRVT